MAVPKRPTKKTQKEPAKKQSTEEQEAVEATAVFVDGEEVDKDALIAELQSQLLSKDDHEKMIDELKAQLAEAEKKAGSSAAVGPKEFRTKPKPGEGFLYFEINWHPKRSDSDEEYVTVGVNGKYLVWLRNVPTVIRSDYLEVADNAFVPKFKQLPGEERKEIGGLKPYTYTINRQIDEDEYDRRKKEGDTALKVDMANRGISQ